MVVIDDATGTEHVERCGPVIQLFIPDQFSTIVAVASVAVNVVAVGFAVAGVAAAYHSSAEYAIAIEYIGAVEARPRRSSPICVE